MVKVTPAWISGNYEDAADKTELVLKGQDVTQIDDISHLVNLKKLDLSENKLKHADSLTGLAHLKSLSVLNLSKNSLPDIGHIFNLPRLAVLNISHNALTILPTGIESLLNLKALVATGNQIKSISNIKLPSSINSLILSHNQIESVDTSDFRHLKLLKKLSLSHNRIHALPLSLPEGLKELRANDNKLSVIPTLPVSLEIVDLGNNLLSDPSSLSTLRLLKNVNLSGNPSDHGKALNNPRLRIVNGKNICERHNNKSKRRFDKPSLKKNKN